VNWAGEVTSHEDQQKSIEKNPDDPPCAVFTVTILSTPVVDRNFDYACPLVGG